MTAVLREDATQDPTAADPSGMGRAWTEDDVLRVLWRHFASQSWAPIPQVTVALRDMDSNVGSLSAFEARRTLAMQSGDYVRNRDLMADRRIDMLLARPAKRTGLSGLETLAIEVKVTRADFLNDIKHPEKQAPWRRAATRHTYAVPAGLVHRDEVPEGSGLIVVKHGFGFGSAEWLLRAPYRDQHNPDLPLRVHVALAHRLAALEASTRGWNASPAAAGDEQDVRAALVAAHKTIDRLDRALDRAQGKAEAWKTAHALAVGRGHPCRWCGEPLKPLSPTNGWFKKWRHVNGDHDAACLETEVQARENEAVDAWEAADTATRQAKLREALRWSFSEVVEAEPWRAFLPYEHSKRVRPTGPEPADVMPSGTI